MKRSGRPVQSVYLHSTHNEMQVSIEGCKQILALVQAHAVCSQCREDFSSENPNVAGILCLNCFLAGNQHLTYVEQLDASNPEVKDRQSLYDPFPARCYLYLDKAGHCNISVAGPGHDYKPRSASRFTLAYWHFPIPEKAQLKGDEINTSGFGWEIYGDVKEDDVVLIQHGDQYYGNEILFIAQRNGQLFQINRRKALHRQLFAQAKAELEATKNEYGMYRVDNEWKAWIQTGDIYRLVARRIKDHLQINAVKPVTHDNTKETASSDPVKRALAVS